MAIKRFESIYSTNYVHDYANPAEVHAVISMTPQVFSHNASASSLGLSNAYEKAEILAGDRLVGQIRLEGST